MCFLHPDTAKTCPKRVTDNKIQTIFLNFRITLDKQLLRSIKKEQQKATNTDYYYPLLTYIVCSEISQPFLVLKRPATAFDSLHQQM